MLEALVGIGLDLEAVLETLAGEGLDLEALASIWLDLKVV